MAGKVLKYIEDNYYLVEKKTGRVTLLKIVENPDIPQDVYQKIIASLLDDKDDKKDKDGD